MPGNPTDSGDERPPWFVVVLYLVVIVGGLAYGLIVTACRLAESPMP